MTKKYRIILNIILIFSVFSLLTAYFIQYILGHQPCNLCLIERYPYLGAIILISLLFFMNRSHRLILSAIFLLFFFGVVVSFYHVGIEQGFFNESFVCDFEADKGNLSKEDLLQQLEKKSPISCKDVTFKLFGLSLATINTVISIILCGIIAKIIKDYDKN